MWLHSWNGGEGNMKIDILNMEEEQVNTMTFFAGLFIPIAGFLFVKIFLEGTARDAVALIMAVFSILVRILEKKLGAAAKYVYMFMPLVGGLVILLSGDGKFGAMTHVYFLWLLLAIAYYDVSVVIVSGSVTLISNFVLILINKEPFLKMHNMTVWVYIAMVYVISVVLAVIIANRTYNLFEMEQQLKNYENDLSYMKELEKKDEKHGEFIHNMIHYLTAIGELAKHQHYDRILSILQDLNVKMEHNSRIIYTNYKVVNAILSQKKRECEEVGVIMDAYVEPGIQFGQVSDGDLVAMLGNLLDNAFQAAEKCQEDRRKVNVNIYMGNNGSISIVKVTNYYSGQLITNKFGFVSTKKEKGIHGIGLKSVKKAAEKYGGYLECFPKEELFTAVLILPAALGKE